MKCPECDEIMEQICMYGTEEEINIEYHCKNCNCLAKLQWHPHTKKLSTIDLNENLPF